MKSVDLAIIGGGASGLSAAIEARRRAPRQSVLILEKEARVGQKILATGNGRCNLSNAHIAPQFYNPEAAPFLDAVEGFTDDLEFFRSLGILTRADSEGRIYPYSNTAASVLDALRFAVDRLGVETALSQEVAQLAPQNGGFLVQTVSGEQIYAKRVILSTGSPAGVRSPGALAQLNFPSLCKSHSVRPFSAALAPVCTLPALTLPLKGLRVRATARLYSGSRLIAFSAGEVSFGNGYLSGICIMDLSGQAASLKKPAVVLDLVPELDTDQLTRYLIDQKNRRGELPLEELLTGLLPKRIGQQLLKRMIPAGDAKISSLNGHILAELAQLLKHWEFPVTGVSDWPQAQVARGGIPAESCVGLESKIWPGLFFCGEVLDVNGRCGGFNLHWAWASGRCAGAAAAAQFLQQSF